MVSIEVIALVLTGLSITASIIYYATIIRNQDKTRRTEILFQRLQRDASQFEAWGEVVFVQEWKSVEELNDSGTFKKNFRQQAESKAAPATGKRANKPQAAAVTPKPAAAPPAASPPAEIFKAYDIRGIVGRTLTTQHMLLIGQALGVRQCPAV